MLAEVAHLLVIYIYSPIAARWGVYFLHGPRSCLRPFRKFCDCEAGVAICFPPGASALGRGGAGRGEQVVVGQVGRRAFWRIKCTVGNLRLCGAVGVANCFPANSSGRAWWGVVGRGRGGGAGWGVLLCNIAPCQSSTHSHASTLSRPA